MPALDTRPRLLRLATMLAFLCTIGCARGVEGSPAEMVEDFATRNAFQGVVLVADGGAVLHAEGYGHEDIEAGVPTTLATRYQLGSISKWITTLVVLRLVDDGTLSLTAPIATYLPEYTGEGGGAVTLHHLLSHTSGVPNDIITAYQADPAVLAEQLPVDEAVRRYASGPLQFAPGTRFDYAHSNWILVKAIIEHATGRTFAENLRATITAPLGLDDTNLFSGDGSGVAHLAIGYTALGPPPVRATEQFPAFLECAGGVYSTAPDLLVLLEALYGGRLLSAASLAALDTVVWPAEDYALGGRVTEMVHGGVPMRALWHSGSNGPSKSRVSRVLPNGLTIITLTNAGTSPEATGALIEDLIAARYE